MIRILFLAVALVAAGTPALAGDDPRCSNYGPGFIYAESTGFCVRISGSVEAGYAFGSGSSFGSHSKNGFHFKSEAGVAVDARKDTDIGPLRLYVAPKGNID